MSAWLEQVFPGLTGTGYKLTSPPTQAYNCIAWAAGVTTAWWWPTSSEELRTFWPRDSPADETVAAFQAAFGTLGYLICPDEALDTGFEKVAIFANGQGVPTHVARQLSSGMWTSKLGRRDDIEHELRAIEGEVYGTVVLFMRRPTS